MSRKIDLVNAFGFSSEDVELCRERGGLLSIELEFTRRCNLRCTYCYSGAGEAVEDELSIGEMESVIAQARALGARKLILLGGGEPLVYSGLRRVIEYADSIGLQQILFTNGTLIDKDIAEFLAAHRVLVVVKRNSLRQSVQDELAGVDGTFDRIERGLAILQGAGFSGTILPLGIQTVICRQNIDEIPAIWAWARERNIIPYVEILTLQGRAKDNMNLSVRASDAKSLFETLESIDRSRFNISWEGRPTIAAFSCKRHLYSCLVNAQGNVQPCTGVDLAVGNVREAALRDILAKSPVIRKLRNVYQHLQGPCGECDYNGECYGCRGNAYQITGDYLASDPTCWHCEMIQHEDPDCLCQQ